MILYTPFILFVALAAAIILAVKLYKNKSTFKETENIAETQAVLTSINVTRVNFISYINKYEFTYFVDGVSYKNTDSESFLFRQGRNPFPSSDVIVEYIRDNPENSRLKFINHNNDQKKLIAAVIIIVAMIVLLRFWR